MPVYDHGQNIYEVMINVPVASGQIKLVASRYGINVESIDHVCISTRQVRFRPIFLAGTV